jgi:hypothetical protein
MFKVTNLIIFRLIPKTAQIVFFSATFPDHVRAFATTVAPQANMISLKQEEVSVDSIKQFYMDCKNAEHKATTLCDIYGLMTIGQSIIFVRVRVVLIDRKSERLICCMERWKVRDTLFLLSMETLKLRKEIKQSMIFVKDDQKS